MDEELRQKLGAPISRAEERYERLTAAYAKLAGNYEQVCHSIGLTNELLFELLEKLGKERCSDSGAQTRRYRNIPPPRRKSWQ